MFDRADAIGRLAGDRAVAPFAPTEEVASMAR
jgi:hypothetical protein